MDEDFCRRVDATVRNTLGEGFTLWVRWQSQWLAWPSWEPLGGDICLGSSKVIELLGTAASRMAPASIASAPDRQALAVPFTQGDALVVAVASLATDELLERLAVSLQQGLALSLQLDESRLVVEESTRQISEDLEQVMYLQTLGEYLQLCAVSRSALDVARGVLPVLRDLIRAESLMFLTPADESGDVGPYAQDGVSLALRIGRQDIDTDACRALVRWFRSAALRQPVIRNRLQGEVDGACLPGLDSFLLAPVAKDDLHTGWLLAVNRTRDPDRQNLYAGYPSWGLSDEEFGTVESGLMLAAASMLTAHAHNVHLFQEKERLLIGVLRSLINAMDAKDSYTCGHSDRVALIARRLGEELRLSREECNTLYVSGLLHDIGKIGVSDAILLKPGKLTNEEYVQIQKHPERGHTILKHLDHLAQALPGVLHHHERYDGRGYPRGLQGEAIPLAARILAVADSYDAMSSCRPYRTALPDAKIETVLKEGAGTQWDSQVIATFLRILPEIRGICSSAEIHTQAILTATLPDTIREGLMSDSLSAALSVNPSR
jgi:HD-GYP domain-containing protein (c-di-GMP phosphodiesterase class II)